MHLVGYLYEDYHDARSLEHKLGKMLEPALVDSALKCPRGVLCRSSGIFGYQIIATVHSHSYFALFGPLWSHLVPAIQNSIQRCMFFGIAPKFHEQYLLILRDTTKTLVSKMVYPGSGNLCRAQKLQLKI